MRKKIKQNRKLKVNRDRGNRKERERVGGGGVQRELAESSKPACRSTVTS